MSELESRKRNPARPSNRKISKRCLKSGVRFKERTPYFRRFESWRYVRIDYPWRKPKGVDNHQRKSKKGWPHLVKIGYRVPKEVRYLHPSGYRDILVHNMKELEALLPDYGRCQICGRSGEEEANRTRNSR